MCSSMIRGRPMRPRDVSGAVRLIAAHPVAAARYGDTLRHLHAAWLKLLGSHGFQGMVWEEVRGSQVGLLAAGTSLFVAEAFVQELKSEPLFWIGPEIARRVARGQSPVLSDHDVVAGNSSGGLNLILWDLCIAPESAARLEVRSQVTGGFFEMHRGFRLREIIGLQAAFPEEVHWILEAGGLFFKPAQQDYVGTTEISAADVVLQPHVLGLTRDLAVAKMTWMSSIFMHVPPQMGLSQGEQRLLLAALRGGTDEELSDELAITVSAVKKAWRSIYDRAAVHLPGTILDGGREDGERGKQKKQRLLAHLRSHPEELRPHSRKLLKQNT